ncbi:LysR substrate-binding domain-containing protein [Nocardioides iriomotensis]|uniref:LysR family transcriptional regulator n=1 Tax=Nocardioides iriomotensis TaxID=715784 RepID=A0A4Q5J4S1_9ACTN|nr:LysR substrate-binding domain-containing protein [Nocardioides iriomotensis]RYU13483.1 LysR family transcriptional regulator [Nocardioides iriomotensis]
MSSRPDLGALDLLVRVAESGSLGAAAREVGIAQPNASRSIARLERQLGVALLTRGPTGSRLTTEGSVVVEWARDALAGVDRVVVGARSLAAQRSPHLTVAASLTVAEYLAPTWITRFRQAHPDLRVSLAVGNSEEVLGRVLAGDVPVGFVEAPTVPRTVRSTTVASDALVVVVAPRHQWAGRRRPLRPDELAETDLVLRETGSGTRQTLERALRRAGVALGESHLELASTAAVKVAAATGAAPAVLSDLAVASEIATGTLVAVPVDLDLSRSLRAVWPAGLALAGPAADLVRLAAG